MEVKRIDVFDFKVVLSEGEFAKLKEAADDYGVSIEVAFKLLIERTLEGFIIY